MKVLDRALARISNVFAFAAAVCTAAIMVLMITDLGLRTVTGASLVGAYEVVVMLIVCVVFLGMPYAERSGTSVRVTLLTDRLGVRAATGVRIVSLSVAFATSCWLTAAAWIGLDDAISSSDYMAGLINFPIWPMRLMIAAGFTVLSLVLLHKIVGGILGFRTGDFGSINTAADAELAAALEHAGRDGKS